MTDETLKTTPLLEEHRALGARIVPFAGWQMPVQYRGVVEEHKAVRERAGLFDVCHMGELELKGPGAVALVDQLVTNDIAGLPVGKAIYTVCCNEQGTILDDLIVYKRGNEDVLVVCNASNRDKISSYFASKARGVDFRDISDETGLLALQGPRAFDVLKSAGADAAILGLGRFHVTQGKIGGTKAWVARTGYTGEDGVEIFCAMSEVRSLFKALLEAGKPHGLEPIGLGARDTLRLEARLSLYGNEIDETTNPLEGGLAWVVKLEKGPFVGRDALLAIRDKGLSRKLVGLEMTGRGIARHGYPITKVDGTHVGVVTSGSPGPSVGKNIGLGYVPADMAEIGTKIGVEIRGKVIEAVVVRTPFYKRPS